MNKNKKYSFGDLKQEPRFVNKSYAEWQHLLRRDERPTKMEVFRAIIEYFMWLGLCLVGTGLITLGLAIIIRILVEV